MLVFRSVVGVMLNVMFLFVLTVSAYSDSAMEFREGWAVKGVAQGGRRPFSPDAVAALMARGTFTIPQDGASITTADGKTQKWERVSADKDGAFDGSAFAGGYLYVTTEIAMARTAMLEASGQGMVYVNGEPRAGDPYGYGRLKLPVALQKGTNVFLFAGGRGAIKARLTFPEKPQFFEADENTLPDIRLGETGEMWASVVVANATERETSGLTLTATVEASGKRRTTPTPLPAIPPFSVRKVGFRLAAPAKLPIGDVKLLLTIQKSGAAQDTATLTIRVRALTETYKRTFLSAIDGSVQYYAIRPALKPTPTNGLILTLHGASVEAIGQADAYGPKDDITLVAPTNRRPFGFDWEDIGRLDALEVLAIAERTIPHDPARVALTGHSMGGHGTWALGSLYPDRFAALAPSAGWISFVTYAGGVAKPILPPDAPETTETILTRGANIHDTLLRAGNLLTLPIFVLHGDADDNVPVSEARQMRDYLTALGHRQVAYHEEPGANHWWDNSPAPGADAVDYAPMMSLLKDARLTPPTSRYEISFVTANPAVASKDGWLTIEQQERSLYPSSATFTLDPKTRILGGATGNTRRFTIDSAALPNAATAPCRQITIDDQTLSLPADSGAVRFLKTGGKWRLTGRTPASEKGAKRGGPFKEAFNNRFILVYGTGGTLEENRWMFARARYDAETFLYRGNGSPDILSDTAYLAHPRRGDEANRNVIVYGNESINAAWRILLADSPIRVTSNQLNFPTIAAAGASMACVFVRPLPHSDTALVAAIGGTGLTGMRCTDRLPYFVSGAAFPDWVIFDPETLEKGASGVKSAGYFDFDWRP